MTQLGDELLIAYSDGELSTRQREEIGCVLAHDPVTALRLKKMQNTRNRFTMLFNDILADHSRLRVENIIQLPESVQESTFARQAESYSTDSPKSSAATTYARAEHEQVGQQGSGQVTSSFLAGTASPVRSKRSHLDSSNLIEPVSYQQNSSAHPDAAGQIAQVQGAKPVNTGLKLLLNTVSAIVILAAGLVAGYFYQDYKGLKAANEVLPNLYAPVVDGGWTTAVINHHSLLRREVIETVRVNQKNISLIQNQLNSALGMKVSIPDLSKHGLSFASAQILTHNHSKIAQISYLPEQGTPVSLYVKKGGKSAALNKGSLGAVNMVHWSQNHNGFVLAGELPHWKLIVMSVEVKRQFAPR